MHITVPITLTVGLNSMYVRQYFNSLSLAEIGEMFGLASRRARRHLVA